MKLYCNSKYKKFSINKKGFSILEVLISTFILSIAVFGIYKLIGENTKAIEKSNMNLNVTNLFYVLENCIENNNSIGNGGYLDLGTELKDCNFLTEEKINTIDGVDYIISTEKTPTSTTKIIFWKEKIYTDFIGTKTGTYIQRK